MNLILISLSISTARKTTKQIVIYVLISETVSTKIGIVRNNKSFIIVEYSK